MKISVTPGAYPTKVYAQCKTKDEFINFVKHLYLNGHKVSFDANTFEIPSKGIIVYLKGTLMTWGIVSMYPNTLSKRNKLRSWGYEEVPATENLTLN